ncbi:NodB homology domain-containing protein [Plasmodiophora brassicae]|uniref:NodB homology domain-containing protein n=1 Tax=Plasmodiophora brassicae TaxID=37360 RepID=A0A0G4J7Y0_PLABS|nr:hypothetical protein PBRA_003161 [Plasmodiophora brassicae]SPQ95636.1 unnamed protein product [Plasmodiophora brassicae]
MGSAGALSAATGTVATVMMLLSTATIVVAADLCHGDPRPDNKCGPAAGDAGCAPGSCCSQYGWCGTGPGYCHDLSICQNVDPGQHLMPAASTCTGAPRADNRCGPAVHNAACPPGQCCSSDGWCGSTSDYCNERSLCTTSNGLRAPATVGDVSVFNWCGPVPWISVTFDDSAFLEPQLTYLLSDLNRLNVPATFFICPLCHHGDVVTFCSQLKRVIDAGHTIQSHSLTHTDFKMATMGADAMAAEINGVAEYLTSHCGLDPLLTMFRPPYGDLFHSQALYVNSIGYTIASWTVDSMDWTGATLPEIEAAISKAYRALGPGASMMIDFRDATYTTPGSHGIFDWLVQAYPGHKFVSAEECFANCQATGNCEAPGGRWPGVFNGVFDEP